MTSTFGPFPFPKEVDQVPLHPKIRAFWENVAELEKEPKDASGPLALMARQTLQLDDALTKALGEIAHLKEQFRHILKFCEGGDPCAASEHAPCHIHEHGIAREALKESEEPV